MIENVDDPTEIKRYRDVVEISQSMFAGNYDDLRNNRKIETESFMMAATFTRTNIRREDLPEGDEIDMCEGMERMAEGFRKEGEARGELKEKQNMLNELLKVKLGSLSSNLEKQLSRTVTNKIITMSK